MSWPEFLLRDQAAAARELMLIDALQIAGATPDSAAIPLASLREQAGG